MSAPEGPPDVVMTGSEPDPGPGPGPGPGPSLVDSPPSSSSESHVSFDPRNPNLPPDEQCTDYTPVFPGDWRDEDVGSLLETGWSDNPVNARVNWQAYVPFWTAPDWDPSIETTIDGKTQRAARGGAEAFMRPTILPRDQDVPRTDYTKRWGISQTFPKNSNNEARSGLTPTGAAAEPAAERSWTHEESWQSYFFDGFTTQELVDSGVYAPDREVPVSDLPAEALNPLFKRERWTQPLIDVNLGGAGAGKIRNFNMKYSLGGKTGSYDAKTNDDVWDALQPSLRLASNVINSQHPTWVLFLRALYHMRRVPRQQDGRTDREKIQENYRQYITLYPLIDGEEMYDNARALWRAGFDPGLATAGILDNSATFPGALSVSILIRDLQLTLLSCFFSEQLGLKWGFYENQPSTNGSTFTAPDWSIRILLNANNVWPLLTDEYSESEKVAVRVKLAMTMLHELAHACHQAHYQMMEQPNRFLVNIPGVQVTRDIATFLQELRIEAVGPGSRNENGRQYFIENDIQMEEGKALDYRIWGSVPDYFPPLNAPSKFRPMIQTRNWPFTHPEIYHQNVEAVRAGAYNKYTRLPYSAFLLFPRSPVYEPFTPIPLSNYSHLLQTSWWDGDFQKFGHDALKISATRADQSQPLQSALATRYNSFNTLLTALVGNRSVLGFIFSTAPNILKAQEQYLILAWLARVSFDIAGAKVMKLRLHYERRTWDDKYTKIRALCQKCVQDLTVANNSLQNYLSDDNNDSGAVDFYQVQDQLDGLLREDLIELHRLVDYEGRYSQCVAAEYFLKDLDDRTLVRRSMHILLGHLQTTCDQVHAVTEAMLDVWRRMGADADFTEHVQECESVYSRLTTAHTAVNSVVQILRGNTLDQRSGPGGRGPLARVPLALRELKYGRNLRIAAMKDFAQISDPKLKRLIKTWLNIIHYNQDIRHDDPDADDVVVGGGTIAELRRAKDQATADALAISLLDRQDQVEANRAQGIKPTEGEDRSIAELQDDMAQLEVTSEIIDLYAESFSEDEQEKLRRSKSA